MSELKNDFSRTSMNTAAPLNPADGAPPPAGPTVTIDDLWAAPTVFRDDLYRGRVVLVSGAGSGIGRGIALLFARLGASVVICGRTAAKLEAVAEFARARGVAVLAAAADIREPEQVLGLFERAERSFGPVDIVINNAGGQFPQPAIDFSVRGWNAVVNNNLNGTWLMMQQAAQRWRAAQRGGSIVNIVAPTERGMPGVAHTVAARAGVIGLSRTVAVEWAPLGIRVNCVSPGLIGTEGLAVYPPEAAREWPKANPMKRWGSPIDIAQACAWIAGPAGNFVTGEVCTVDGGGRLWGELWTAGRPQWYQSAPDAMAANPPRPADS
jgi:citronellol/citronellal dehydrogenase